MPGLWKPWEKDVHGVGVFCRVSLVALLPLCFDCAGNGFVSPQPSTGPLSLPKEHDGYFATG